MSDSCEDAVLIERIARDRDQKAIDELYQRYEAPAFKFGRYLTGSRDLAEEAVQETMLQIWRSARTFRGGPAKAWIFRILANKCSKLRKNSGRRRREEQLSGHEKNGVRLECPTPQAGMERGELYAILRQSLEKLSFEDRKLVVLYYGMNFTEEEIGKSLTIPQSTVSRRLCKQLETLRANLIQAGHAAAVPLARPQVWGAAIFAGFAPPPGLRARVLRRIAEAGRQDSAPAATRANPKKAARAYVAAGALAALAAAGLLFSALSGTSGPVADSPAASLPASAPGLLSVPAPPKIRARWTFEAGPPRDIKVLRGEWRWVPAQAGLPSRMAAGNQEALLELPMLIPEGTCLEVKLAGEPTLNSGKSMLSAAWNAGGYRDNYSVWMAPRNRAQKGPGSCTRTYLTEGSEIVTFWNPSSNFLGARLIEYEARVTREPRVIIQLRNVVVAEVEIRELAAGEIPERFRDPKKLIEKLNLKKIPHPGRGDPSPAAASNME